MGGWYTTIAQRKIKPIVVQNVVLEINKFISEFNNWFSVNDSTQYIGPIKPLAPVGSSYYYLQDIDNGSDKTYGDIDYLFEFPTVWNNQKEIINFYKEKLKLFFKERNPIEILDVADNYLIVNNITGPIQVDILVTIDRCLKWTLARHVPPHNLKGVVIGSFYTMFNRYFKIMIGDLGATIRVKDNGNPKLVLRKRKNIKIITISRDYEHFWEDIFYSFGYWIKDKHIRDLKTNYFLSNYPGLNINNIKLENLTFGYLGFINALRDNKLNGFNVYLPYSYKEMREIALKGYYEVTAEQLNHPKFKKAKTKEDQEQIEKFRADIEIGREIVSTILK